MYSKRCCKGKDWVRYMFYREARQLGAPTDTHFCLSSFPLRAGLQQVMAGLHFWQTRGSSTLSKRCMAPLWLSAAVIKPRQPEPTNKKLTRYWSTAANFGEVVSKGRHGADSSAWGEGFLLGRGKTPPFGLISEILLLVGNFSKLSEQNGGSWDSKKLMWSAPVSCMISNSKEKNRNEISLSFQSLAIPCSAAMSLYFLINTSTRREVGWAGAQCPERCFELN